MMLVVQGSLQTVRSGWWVISMWVSQGGTGRVGADCTVQGVCECISEGDVDGVNGWLQVRGLGESRVVWL